MNQIYSTCSQKTLIGCNLVAVYNTHVYGTYKSLVAADSNIFNCLLITIQGTAAVVLKNKTKVILGEKSIFIGKHSDMLMLFTECEHWHFLCYWFNPIGFDAPVNTVLDLPNMDVDKENEFATKIIQLLQTGISGNVEYANALFTCKFLETKQMIPMPSSKNSQLFNEIISYINVNIEHLPKIQDIAKHFAYSEKHFRTIFEQNAKISPKQYIIKRKLERAAVLLLTSSYTLEELSELLDFYSVSHLINNFKKEYGVTPSAYKKRHM